VARLLIKTAGLENRTLELRLGINRIGRDPNCDFPLVHPTISSIHCEIEVSADGVRLRDCGSTNGTFINNEPVKEIWLRRGQELRLGDVELTIESVEVNVAIPKFEHDRPKPPALLEGGLVACARHAQEPATYRCTNCKEVMCNDCIRILRIKGGQSLFLCPTCSHKCEPVEGAKAATRKKGFFARLVDTVKMRLSNATRPRQR